MRASRAGIGSMVGGLVLCAGIACSGCATPSPRTETPAPPKVFVGNQGGAWEAALPPAATDSEGADWLNQRRDDSLSVQEPSTALAYGVWPDPPAPSLDQLRQVFLIQRPQFIAFYSSFWGGYGFGQRFYNSGTGYYNYGYFPGAYRYYHAP
jgi:hypothetical protein